ncbi:hypothetical protein AVEN_230231-1 [Araneus ventricosus]|uniref:Uncharacterized protein n=1 Tax=Araneus ventricosus TaxID=182803 RepID=A0A4Y2DUV1_ARAVE|nr:hypothetical protein AVEN_230231-1 [Araneus ventricosus]
MTPDELDGVPQEQFVTRSGRLHCSATPKSCSSTSFECSFFFLFLQLSSFPIPQGTQTIFFLFFLFLKSPPSNPFCSFRERMFLTGLGTTEMGGMKLSDDIDRIENDFRQPSNRNR